MSTPSMPADDRSFAAGQRATAEHRGGDRLQLHALSDPETGWPDPVRAAKQHAGEACGRAAQ